MRSPRIKFGNYEIRYKQVPYDNRYFYIYEDGYERAKIDHTFVDKHGVSVFWFVQEEHERFYKFLEEKVSKYDEYLDSFDK